jgi:phosphoserine phosphatase
MSATEEKDQFTGLILLTGIDKPGITATLFETLAPFSLTVLDIEQVVIRERLILTLLIACNPAHSEAIDADLEELAKTLDVDIATSFSSAPISSIAAKTGLVHAVLLSPKLLPSSVAKVAQTISELGGNIESISRTASYPVTAIEFVISNADQKVLKSSLASIAIEHGVDIAVQPGGLMRHARKLVLLDVDSTLIQQEVIELLASKAGVNAEVVKITDAAMRGELDFEQSLIARVALLTGLPESAISQVQSEIVLTPGARTLIRTLQRLGHTVCVVSGGFHNVIDPLLKELSITHYRANTLEIVDGKLTGKVVGPIIDRAAKAQALKDFAAIEKIHIDQTIAIGDGANDLDMIAIAGLGIAFNAKPAVKAAADSSVSAPYLDSVLYLLGIAREEIEEADSHS